MPVVEVTAFAPIASRERRFGRGIDKSVKSGMLGDYAPAHDHLELPARTSQLGTRFPFEDGTLNQATLSDSERRVLHTFRQFLMNPHQMLCFYGPNLKQNKAALESLTNKELLAKDSFAGGYSLTESGYAVMNQQR